MLIYVSEVSEQKAALVESDERRPSRIKMPAIAGGLKLSLFRSELDGGGIVQVASF